MFTVRKDDGTIIQITLDEYVGERREDGRFHVKLKDGSEGIMIRESELAAERKTDAEALQKYIDRVTEEERDKRGGLQQLIEEWPPK